MIGPKPKGDFNIQWGFWTTVQELVTNNPLSTGMWTADYDLQIQHEGITKSFVGSDTFLDIDPITYELGTNVKVQHIGIGPIAPAGRAILRGYNTRQAPIQIICFTMGPTGSILSMEVAFEGTIDRFEISDGPADEHGNITVLADMEVVSNARMLSKGLTLMMSDASQRLRHPNDGFRRYSDVSGTTPVKWMGEVDNPHRAREINIRNRRGYES